MKISFSVGPLCTSPICAWFHLAGSRQSLTFPFDFGKKLLHHSAVSSMPSGAMMCCCCTHSNYSLDGCCRAYAMHLEGTWYGLLSGLACNENVPSKYLIPLNTSLNYLCIHCVILSLACLSASMLRPGMKYFMLLLLLSLTIALSSISKFEPSVFPAWCLFCTFLGHQLPSTLLCCN